MKKEGEGGGLKGGKETEEGGREKEKEKKIEGRKKEKRKKRRETKRGGGGGNRGHTYIMLQDHFSRDRIPIFADERVEILRFCEFVEK
jgi:hypothetical protein